MTTTEFKLLLSDVWSREVSADEAFDQLDLEFGTDNCGRERAILSLVKDD